MDEKPVADVALDDGPANTDTLDALLKTSIDAAASKERTDTSTTPNEPISDALPDEGKAVPKDAQEGEVKTEVAKEPEEDNFFAPKHWTEDERKAFNAAPAEVKQAIDKLVKNLNKGFTQKTMALADERRFADEVKAAFQPHHKQEMTALGLNEGAVLKNFLRLHDDFKRDPINYVKMIMRERSITPEQLGIRAPDTTMQEPTSGQAAVTSAPDIAAIQRELAEIKGAWRGATEAQQQQRMSTLVQDIQRFAHDVGSDGLPLRQHFDALQPQIMGILQHDPQVVAISDPIERLQAAYDRAVWQNPDTRAQSLEAEKVRERAAWERERTKGAITTKPRVGSAAAAKKTGFMTLDDALSSAIKIHGQ
jgi:hypothetical protein